jgi:hypothetical protein
MPKLLSIVAALGILVVAEPAIAQKQSCEAVCVKRCETANAKSWCIQNCTSRCNQNRSK